MVGQLTRSPDGTTWTANGESTPIEGKSSHALNDGATAEVNERGSKGPSVKTGGEFPVRLKQAGDRLKLKVGDAETTLVQNEISNELFSALVANRRNGANITQQSFFDIDVLNHSQMAALHEAGATSHSLQGMINGNMLAFGLRR